MRRFPGAKSARDKVMDYIARRNHSELELRRKLGLRYEAAEIDDAIEFAYKHNWMVAPEALSEEFTRALSRRKKSQRYIEQSLRAKGLPAAPIDRRAELEKARALVRSKLSKEAPFDYEEKKKIHRLLSNRGFDLETIQKVMKANDGTDEDES